MTKYRTWKTLFFIVKNLSLSVVLSLSHATMGDRAKSPAAKEKREWKISLCSTTRCSNFHSLAACLYFEQSKEGERVKAAYKLKVHEKLFFLLSTLAAAAEREFTLVENDGRVQV